MQSDLTTLLTRRGLFSRGYSSDASQSEGRFLEDDL